MANPAESGDEKQRQLDPVRVDPEGTQLTTDQGLRVDDTDNSLTVGERGPTLMEDFHFREKVTHFDHERIPERVVHARGAGAYGHFQVYDASLSEYTAAEFLTDPSLSTPVFVRFSTVAGSRGSADTVRDVRGFATKFYTRQGNFDLVGNNIPVFFIQDGIKFPDFVHAVKPEPHNEIPQAQSAHDTFWDFVQLQPEIMHMVMWVMSDRAIPRSFAMMQGFGVHTFRLVNAQGRGTFVKFHWKPTLGTHSLEWDEAQKIAGKDPDFNRRDLWDNIEAGHHPEYELGVQLVPEADEHTFDFDLLDPTKIIPEEEVPVRPVGRLVLDRNPQNFFAETEQVAFHLGNVGGIGDRLTDAGAICEVLAPRDGAIQAANGARVEITKAMNTMASVLYDAVLVPGGEASARALAADGLAVHFVAEAFKHGKPIGAINEGVDVLTRAGQLIDAIAQHRHWNRDRDAVPA